VPGAEGFGASVALSGDGNTALISGGDVAANKGAVWVFTRSGSTWSQGQELTSVHNGTQGAFGRHIALSSDASTALISEDCFGRGAVWVFTRSGSTWTQHQELTSSDRADCAFGGAVALSGDGTTALILLRDTSVAVYTHPNTGNTWAPAGPAVPVTGTSDFGDQLALSSDGTAALMADEGANNLAGSVYPFARTGAPCEYPSTVEQQGGLLGYWRLGESSGTTAADSSSAGHNGTYTGGFTLGQPGAILGDSNTSVALNGTTGKVALPSLGTASDWTIQGWTNLADTATQNPNGDNALYASPTGVRLIIRPAGFYFDDLSSGTSQGAKNGTTDPNLGRWVDWVLTRSGSTLSLYRNGQLIASSSVGAEGPSLLNGAIGAQGSAYHLHGTVDDVAASDTTLGQAAVETLYGCSGWGPPPSS
jgi:hypothetical protein